MRIITGKLRGRALVMPRGIKPTQNVVRKAVFDILGDIEGTSFLELFAGSGAVGLEAFSRGASEIVLVEYNRDCQLAIRKNIEALKAIACELYPQQVENAIERLQKERRIFDIIFLDPPYYEDLPKKTLQTLGAYDILAPNGLVITQHFKRDEVPQESGQLVLIKESHYGSSILSIYRKK